MLHLEPVVLLLGWVEEFEALGLKGYLELREEIKRATKVVVAEFA